MIKMVENNAWESTRRKIKDPESIKEFDKAMKKIVEQSKGGQHQLDDVYDAETDEYFENYDEEMEYQ